MAATEVAISIWGVVRLPSEAKCRKPCRQMFHQLTVSKFAPTGGSVAARALVAEMNHMTSQNHRLVKRTVQATDWP